MEKRKHIDYFSLLEVDENCTKEQLQKAFLLKASIWHPDKAPNDGDREHYTKIYQDLQLAYKILSNEESRKQYVDSRQTSNLEFKLEKRDVNYLSTDSYKTETGEFDKKAFEYDFFKTRENADVMNELHKVYDKKDAITTDDINELIQRRNKDACSIQQIFDSYDPDSFNRAFDYMKTAMPSKELEDYTGNPRGFFSTGGLQESDSFSGLDLREDNFNPTSMNDLVSGTSFNPTALTALNISEFQTGEKYGKERKLTNEELLNKIKAVQEDRRSLSSLDKICFINEPSEIETIYSELFQPLNLEGLEAPIKIAEAKGGDVSKIGQKIALKKKSST